MPTPFCDASDLLRGRSGCPGWCTSHCKCCTSTVGDSPETPDPLPLLLQLWVQIVVPLGKSHLQQSRQAWSRLEHISAALRHRYYGPTRQQQWSLKTIIHYSQPYTKRTDECLPGEGGGGGGCLGLPQQTACQRPCRSLCKRSGLLSTTACVLEALAASKSKSS